MIGIRASLLALCCIVSTMVCAGTGSTTKLDDPASIKELDRVVQALCTKDLVLLGEDAAHAGASTIAVKRYLVEHLVNECGFRGVVFESQFYDMLDFEHAVAKRSATRAQLANGIGALWSNYPVFWPLLDWLLREAQTGRVRVAGMDPQVGGINGQYSANKLPDALASVLADKQRIECAQIIGRHNRWEYDETHAFDDTALHQLERCLTDIDSALDALGPKAPAAIRDMAGSYASYIEFANGDGHGLRDQAMFENLQRIQKRWPQDTRVLVWTASVHAAKSLDGVSQDTRPFGSYVHEAFGERAAAIGFSALSGSYGHVGGRGTSRALPAATQDSLEVRAFAATGKSGVRFLDHTQLQAMGKIPAHAFTYGTQHKLDWSQALDGMIVLREETAAVAESSQAGH